MYPFITKDDKFIYSEDTLKEYINNTLGLDMEDLAELVCPEKDSYIQQLQDYGEEYELLYDGAINCIYAAVEELRKISSKLESGKGLTKTQAATAINNVILNFLNY